MTVTDPHLMGPGCHPGTLAGLDVWSMSSTSIHTVNLERQVYRVDRLGQLDAVRKL